MEEREWKIGSRVGSSRKHSKGKKKSERLQMQRGLFDTKMLLEKICGPSCQCINCTNIPNKAVTTELETLDLLDEEQEQEEEYVSDSDDELDDLRVERETDDIMRFVFGDSSASDDSDTDYMIVLLYMHKIWCHSY